MRKKYNNNFLVHFLKSTLNLSLFFSDFSAAMCRCLPKLVFQFNRIQRNECRSRVWPMLRNWQQAQIDRFSFETLTPKFRTYFRAHSLDLMNRINMDRIRTKCTVTYRDSGHIRKRKEMKREKNDY